MDFRLSLKSFSRWLKGNRYMLLYLVFLAIELTAISKISDLPNSLNNWTDKAEQIAAFNIPSDNFYGPGAALLLVPFLWAQGNYFVATLFYFLLGALGYWKLTLLIENRLLKFISRIILPLNFYLLWLIYSSQDTVFEFALLTWSLYFLVRRRFVLFSLVTFLLCETRAGYWVFFLGSATILFSLSVLRKEKQKLAKVLAIPLLIISSTFNYFEYDSPSPALEGGMAAYFAYSKYHYLALPKMDMDVFLSGPQGIFSKDYKPLMPEGTSAAEENSIYLKAGINSALENKKETILGWMQKFDSYFFDVQKVPHLPGRYVLNQTTKTIEIQDERLTWSLVLGNLSFELYRSLLVVSGFIATGILLASRLFLSRKERIAPQLWFLALPYLFGVVPGLLIYTETRFKIVSEMLLVPLIAEIFAIALARRKKLSTT